MREIVVLDTVLLGEEHKARLAALGRLTLYEGRPASRADLLARLAPANVALVSETHLDREALQMARHLELISLWAAGFDNVDLQAARELDITVCNAPGCSATKIAEHTIAVAIYFIHRLREADAHVRSRGYSWEAFTTSELRGQTVGVIGLGRIGSRVAEYARLLGCRVIAHTRNPSPERAARLGVSLVGLETLLRESDVVSINTALTPETEGLIGPEEFALMERRPILINTARGRVVHQAALLEALRNGQVRAAALDVLREEPPDPDDPLLKLENVLFTPHSAGSSFQTFECLSQTCVENVAAFLAGRPQNVV